MSRAHELPRHADAILRLADMRYDWLWNVDGVVVMRVLVCGGRDFNDGDAVFSELDKLCPTLIIEGGAKGADTWAWKYSKRRNIDRQTISAEWDKHGKAAGPMRNQRMIDEGKPDVVLAFPGGKGTADMVRRAERAGIRVVRTGY